MKITIWICAALAAGTLAACTPRPDRTDNVQHVSDSIRQADSLAAVAYQLQLDSAAAAETAQE